MKIMGLDFGSKTCGVAMSDSLLMTSQPVEIIRRSREGQIRKTLSRIEDLIKENDVRLIVLGLPLNMNDTEGTRAKASLDFGDHISRRTGLPVVMSDERLTTEESYEIMDRMGIRREDRGKYVDMIAANVILQEYMENHRSELEELKETADQMGSCGRLNE